MLFLIYLLRNIQIKDIEVLVVLMSAYWMVHASCRTFCQYIRLGEFIALSSVVWCINLIFHFFVDYLSSNDFFYASHQSFDLLTMTPDEMDFTSRIELEPQLDNPKIDSTDWSCRMTRCYGVVLWFETGFTSRFCKEMPIVLSTSPYTPKTHWSQTSLTFREPIAIALAKPGADRFAAVGTEACSAVKIYSRISIARASPHRSVDISLEISGICPDGRKRSWPIQIFNLS